MVVAVAVEFLRLIFWVVVVVRWVVVDVVEVVEELLTNWKLVTFLRSVVDGRIDPVSIGGLFVSIVGK